MNKLLKLDIMNIKKANFAGYLFERNNDIETYKMSIKDKNLTWKSTNYGHTVTTK